MCRGDARLASVRGAVKDFGFRGIGRKNNPSHIALEAARMEYRCEAASVLGFIQQLAVDTSPAGISITSRARFRKGKIPPASMKSSWHSMTSVSARRRGPGAKRSARKRSVSALRPFVRPGGDRRATTVFGGRKRADQGRAEGSNQVAGTL